MDRTSLSLSSIAWIVALVSVVLAPALVGPAVAAVTDVDERPDSYAVEQGGECWTVFMEVDESQDVVEHYDYRAGEGTFWGSYGTQDLQLSGVSQLYVFRGADGDSLIVLHDALDDGEGGGSVSMIFGGLPGEAEWPVEDDDYEDDQNVTEDQDDQFVHEGDESRMHWMWSPNRTDGGALRGIAHQDYDGIEIDATIGEGSYGDEEENWPHADDSLSWEVRTGEDSLEPLDENEAVTFRRGDCSPPVADLSASPDSPTVGEDVTFDASSSSDGGEIVEYRWDLNGDGSVNDTTTEPTYTHQYTNEGEVTASVEVVDEQGNTATATTTFDVQLRQVTAVAEVPETAMVDESVTFDGTNSTPSDAIESYRWTVDGTEHQGAVVEHTFTSAGTYDVTLNVEGESDGVTDSTTETIDVRRPFSANVTANLTNVSTGVAISFDAVASPEDLAAEYRYDFGDGETATGPTAVHAYDASGEYTVTVTVTSTDGRSAESTTVVTVEADEAPGDGEEGDGGEGGDGDAGDGGNGDGNSAGGGGGGGGGGGAIPPPGIPEIELVGASLDTDSASPGERVDVAAELENSGNGAGTTVLALEVDGTVVDTLNVYVGADDTRTYSLDHSFDAAGEYDLSINGTSAGTLTVVDDADGGEGDGSGAISFPGESDDVSLFELSRSARTVAVGESVTFEAVLTNDGDAPATVEVPLRIDGEVSSVRTVEVPPGGNASVAFERTFTSSGAYEVSVGETGRTVVVEAVASASGTRDPGDERGGGVASVAFGVLGIVALVGMIVGLSRWV